MEKKQDKNLINGKSKLLKKIAFVTIIAGSVLASSYLIYNRITKSNIFSIPYPGDFSGEIDNYILSLERGEKAATLGIMNTNNQHVYVFIDSGNEGFVDYYAQSGSPVDDFYKTIDDLAGYELKELTNKGKEKISRDIQLSYNDFLRFIIYENNREDKK